jgi:DNA-binding response OmpR family regulator
MPTPTPPIPTTLPATILVVEDDEVLGQVLARVLSCTGRVARHVRTATEALERVREERPRLVLVDAGLRDGTGLKLVDAIRKADSHLPVIVLSAHHLEKSELPGHAERLVTKSIDLPELRRTIDAALLECVPGGAEALRRPSMSH